jgi:tripartite-type tricarboxylate transporter receptor subunit TctC
VNDSQLMPASRWTPSEEQFAVGGLAIFAVWLFAVLPFVYGVPLAESNRQLQAASTGPDVVGSIRFAGGPSSETPTSPRKGGWPVRPITMVVPFAAGGPTDVVGRIVAQRLGEILEQPVTIENLGGAGGMTGAQRVAQAQPDGYQVLLGTVGTHAYNQTLYKHPLYSATTDFTPVALVAEQPLVLVTRKDFPAETLADFIAYVRANADKLSFGSGGAGASTHLGCVLLNAAIGVNVQHVPYKGSAPALLDLAAGRIDYVCDAVTTASPQIQSHNVKPIALLARGRSPVLPDVPTANEQGLKNFEANNWIGLFFPKGTPNAIVQRLHDATVEAINTPSVRQRMQTIGTDLVSVERTTPDYLKRFVATEIDKWAAPIKASGVSGL